MSSSGTTLFPNPANSVHRFPLTRHVKSWQHSSAGSWGSLHGAAIGWMVVSGKEGRFGASADSRGCVRKDVCTGDSLKGEKVGVITIHGESLQDDSRRCFAPSTASGFNFILLGNEIIQLGTRAGEPVTQFGLCRRTK